MSAKEQPLVRAQGIPGPQYYSPENSQFEFIEGRDGANMFVQLGTIAGESWEGSSNITKTFPSKRFGFSIINDGATDVIFTISGNTRTLKRYEAYSALFEPFTSVQITTTSAYRAEVLK